jgi:hypothetical protein
LRQPGSLEFKDASQNDVKVPVSFKGLEASLKALEKE